MRALAGDPQPPDPRQGMFRSPIPRTARALALATLLAAAAPALARTPDFTTEQASVLQWREERFASLTSDTGWLTLTG